MNGGSFIRTTRKPLKAPRARPTTRPIRSAAQALYPHTTATLPITAAESTVIEPTERSMPAVRMTSVWASARVPMIMTWARIVEMLVAVRKRSVDRLK